MFRKFLRDERGNYMLMTAAAIVPIMGALAIGVDYTEMSRQRQDTLNALDAAGIATARRIVEGATDDEAKAYAKSFFEANLGAVDPADTTLTVLLPQNNTGGGTLKMSAALKYKPYFLPTFLTLIGKSGSSSGALDFAATSEIRLKNTLEVALVLDNSGSMDFLGTGSGKKRIELLKDAAKQLVDTMAQQAALMKQISKPVQFALVPFSASVNVGSSNATASWMDTDGLSSVHHENFDWSSFTDPNKLVTLSGGVYYKKGSGWGTAENEKMTRFTLYKDMQRVTGYTWVPNLVYECTKYKWDGSCKTWGWVDHGSDVASSWGTYSGWTGCVETRPSPYDVDDTAPSKTTPDTLFVPSFAPDESDSGSNNSYWGDVTSSSSALTRQTYALKYYTPSTGSAPDTDEGPNLGCTTKAITPLTDVSTTAGKDSIKASIDAMGPTGNTNVPEGMAWGWRVLSSKAPFTEGRADTEKGNDKVVIVLTDGANTYSTSWSDSASNKSTYAAYGYAGRATPGYTYSRMFQGTSSSVSKSDYSSSNYTKAMNEHFSTLCTNAKAAGVIVMTVSLDLDSTKTDEKAQIESMKACSSDSRFRKDSSGKPVKLYWNSTGGSLAQTFKDIAAELSNLRIVG